MMKHWTPLSTDYLDQRKIQTLPNALFKILINLRCLAGQLDRGGLIPSLEDCALAMHMSPKQLGKAIDQLTSDGLLIATPDGLKISDWQEVEEDAG